MQSITPYSSPSLQEGGVDLPARITKAASKQTYYTIRFLVDRDRVQDAYRAYAYFRWVDDLLDDLKRTRQEKIEFINRQRALLEACYRKETPPIARPEERMLVELVGHDEEKDSGLQFYLRNMMKVMAFDAGRCGRVISHAELTEYTHLLATAVTELIFYFIGHTSPPDCGERRYHAVCGAHVVHMLRDTVEDISAGYYNIPGEYIRSAQISFEDLHSIPFRHWVYQRVNLARQYFNQGRQYFTQVKSIRCRLACFAYTARFEWQLRTIEQDQFCLRSQYPQRKSLKAGLWVVWRTLTSSFNLPWFNQKMKKQVSFTDRCQER